MCGACACVSGMYIQLELCDGEYETKYLRNSRYITTIGRIIFGGSLFVILCTSDSVSIDDGVVMKLLTRTFFPMRST